MQGTCYVSHFEGQSFLIDTGQDFTTWAGSSGNTPYMVILTDSGGKQAVGYLGEEGTSYTFGDNIVTNGGMEIDDNWSDLGTPVTNERSSIKAKAGTYSRHIVTDGTTEGIQQTLAFSVGKLYKCDSWCYADIEANTYRLVNAGLGLDSGDITLLLDLWQECDYTRTAVAASGAHQLYNRNNPGADFYIDVVSVREILTPPLTSGVKIYSSLNGSTQSWAAIESGFDPNAIMSYQITEAY